MTTFNGNDENLLFRCNMCNRNAQIEVDLDNINDRNALWDWLKQHSADGGDYINVPVDKTEQKIRILAQRHFELNGGYTTTTEERLIAFAKKILEINQWSLNEGNTMDKG